MCCNICSKKRVEEKVNNTIKNTTFCYYILINEKSVEYLKILCCRCIKFPRTGNYQLAILTTPVVPVLIKRQWN